MAALQTGIASLVQSATQSTQVQPKPVRNGILGLVLGIVLGISIAFLREVLDTRQLVISIAAGVSLQTLESLSYHPAIVRSMPNTPAHVGEGMTVWVASHAVTPAQLGWAGVTARPGRS